MKCQVCHLDAGEGAAFCPHCGAQLGVPAEGTASVDAALAAARTVRRRAVVDVPEETLWEGSYSPKAMFGSLVGAGVLTALLVGLAAWMADTTLWMAPLAAIGVVWLLVAVRLVTKRLGVHYRLTNQMFYHQHGVLTRVSNRVEAIDINDVTYVQGLLDRLVNVGRINIVSSDQTSGNLWVEGVENVQAVAQLIDKARRAERLRRGISVEAVGGTGHTT